jgi:transcriptional regulator with XRE-family HTH domain
MKNMKLSNIGKNVKELRLFIGITIDKLSKGTGLTPAAISQIENNKRVPELKSVLALMKFFNVTFERLLK